MHVLRIILAFKQTKMKIEKKDRKKGENNNNKNNNTISTLKKCFGEFSCSPRSV